MLLLLNSIENWKRLIAFAEYSIILYAETKQQALRCLNEFARLNKNKTNLESGF